MMSLALYFFIAPAVFIVKAIGDLHVVEAPVPEFTVRWHRQLTPRFTHWAQLRTGSGRASELALSNISATEWPMFSAAYYLWASESIEQALRAQGVAAAQRPSYYARAGIQAAVALMLDPANAAWVKKHWGDTYLEQDNIFYRMLLMHGLISYQKLSGDASYEVLLREQVQGMAQELGASPAGLLDDYPGQCYPIDVLPAIAAIEQAGVLLGDDYRDFVRRALRGFSGELLDSQSQLPAYQASAKLGVGIGPARGVGAAYMLIWAPSLWPKVAANWYVSFEEHFWQQSSWLAGFREFDKSDNRQHLMFDVDAGPVWLGYGTAASAFGMAAAKVNGRWDHLLPLAAEALTLAWPLPNGTWLLPRQLSNLTDAPFVGETALLFAFTRHKSVSVNVTPFEGFLPGIVYVGVTLYLILGALVMAAATVKIQRAGQCGSNTNGLQYRLVFWGVLLLAAALLLALGYTLYALILLLVAYLVIR